MGDQRGPAAALPRDVPEAYIPSDRRVAIAAGASLSDRTHGAGLFADISGFTALTEALAAEVGGHRASEELTAHLNGVFHSVIAELDRFGGSVIYFSGDAITCWLDGDDGLRATAAAFAMLAALRRDGRITTRGGRVVQLEMKVAVAVGDARRFLVGDPRIQLIDVLAGALVDRLAAAESVAKKGEVVLDEAALEALDGAVRIAERRRDPDTLLTLGVAAGLVSPVADAPLPPPSRPLEPHEVRPWLLPAVYDRLRAGRGEFLAELRPAIPLFLRFRGIDFDEDEAAIEQLDAFVRRAQTVLSEYGGNVLQLTMGDKGAYLYAIFGAPLAHEDDAARAVAAALQLRAMSGDDSVADIQIGITCGRLRSGTYGHELRRTYCCLGDAVNLAARLMTKAPPGEILVDEALHAAAGSGFHWEPLSSLELKGKKTSVSAFRLIGTKARSRLDARYDLPMFGREAEIAAICERFAAVSVGDGQVVGVRADAGMGKSRLLAEAVRIAAEASVAVHVGECQAYGANTSYFVWQSILNGVFGHPEDLEALESTLREIDPALVSRLPLLGPPLGLSIPDNDLTRSFDAKLRKASAESLIVEVLQARARDRPLILVLEDCHWIDQLSRDLLRVVGRAAARLPIALLLAYRPLAGVARELGVGQLPHFTELVLDELDPTQAELLIRAKLAQTFGVDEEVSHASAALVELVTGRAQGNPFYIEELLAYIRSEGVDPENERALAALELPDSLHSLILSRIDTLAEPPRRTLKVASVVGRIFRAPTLPSVHPELGTLDDVVAALAELSEAELVSLDRQEQLEYLFRHVVIQQVAYESMPFATRAALHERVGRQIESTEQELDQHLDLLAHHYYLSENDYKKREYLRRAADAAGAEYANDAAIEYFRRLLPLVDEDARGGVQLELGKVLELVGDWDEAELAFRRALELARGAGGRLRARAETAMGELARKRGQYDEAADWFRRAGRGFDTVGDEEGKGLVLHLEGTLAAQRGDYDGARRSYEESLHIRLALEDKAALGGLFSNLGIVAEYVGDYESARLLHEQGIAVREQAGDRWGVGVSGNNLGNIARLQGDLDEARTRLEEALRVQREVGDRWMIANVQNNLANVLREQGDHERARSLYADALQVYGDLGDSWALAFLFEDVAALAAAIGDAPGALRLAGAAETRRAEIGTPRSPTDEEQLEAVLASSGEALSAVERAQALDGGRALSLAEAVAEARRVCEGADAYTATH